MSVAVIPLRLHPQHFSIQGTEGFFRTTLGAAPCPRQTWNFQGCGRPGIATRSGQSGRVSHRTPFRRTVRGIGRICFWLFDGCSTTASGQL